MTRHLLTLFVLGSIPACVQDFAITKLTDEPVAEPPHAPAARCDVYPNPVAPPFESATWVGADSVDPDGYAIIDWRWKLEQVPEGSSVHMPEGGADREGFMPDLVGEYVAVLEVENEYGDISEPCTAVLEAIPAEDLRVEMFWEIPGDDMDLHLLRDRAGARSDDDCYYMNCTPGSRLNWGDTSSDLDDPHLDLDDIPGTGPENINIVSPSDDVYFVGVHDYKGASIMRDANAVTVNVWMNGEMLWSDTRMIEGEDDTVLFAEIDWANGEVRGL